MEARLHLFDVANSAENFLLAELIFSSLVAGGASVTGAAAGCFCSSALVVEVRLM